MSNSRPKKWTKFPMKDNDSITDLCMMHALLKVI